MNTQAIVSRIKERLEATEQQAAVVSRNAGLSSDAIRNILNGKSKNPRTDTLLQIAKQLGCTIDYLLGKSNSASLSISINVVGYVGAGGELIVIDDHSKGAGLDTIEAPAGTEPDSVAVIVRGNSMYPIYQDGTVIIYHDCQSDISERVNKLSIVRCIDGRIMLKTIQRGIEPNTFDLISFNSSPIQGVKLDWAAPIDWIKPA